MEIHFEMLTVSIFNIRTIQRKQKEIKDLRSSLEKLSSDNEKLNKKLEAAWLESSLGARVVKAEMINEDKDGHGDDKMGQDEGRRRQEKGKDEHVINTEDEATVVNEGLDTNRSEGMSTH